MNDLGLAVGNNFDAQGNSQPFIYDVATGTETPITFQSVADPNVNDINDAGQMVGFGVVSGTGITEGLYLNGQGGVQFLNPPGATGSKAFGLNNTGQIVGEYADTAGQEHGFLFDIATQAYTTLDFPNATSTAAKGINDHGQVVGFYSDGQGTHGMELTVANV
jgi:probable HAF family extracellular repeat protein